MKVKLDTTTMVCTFTFDGFAPEAIHAARVPAAKRAMAELMGLQAKVRDTAALSRKQKDGSIITITEAMRHDAVVKTRDALYSDAPWNTRASGADKDTAFIANMTAALATVRNVTAEDSAKWITERAAAKGMTERVYLNGMLNSAKVQSAYMAVLAAAAGSVVIDADAELADIE